MKALLCPKGLAQWNMLRFASGPSILFFQKKKKTFFHTTVEITTEVYAYIKSKLVLPVMSCVLGLNTESNP